MEGSQKRVCAMCHKVIINRRGQARYCSGECLYISMLAKRRHKRQVEENAPQCKCHQCSVVFQARFKEGALFCSTECRYQHMVDRRKKRLTPVECSHCATMYIKKRTGQQYCSEKCRILCNSRKRDFVRFSLKPMIVEEGQGAVISAPAHPPLEKLEVES